MSQAPMTKKRDDTLKLRRKNFYMSLFRRFSITMLLKNSLPRQFKKDWQDFQQDIEQLNRVKNMEILNLSEAERQFVDPNHLVRLYDMKHLIDPILFNMACLDTDNSVQTPKRTLEFTPKLSYKLITVSQAAMYLNPDQFFTILDKHRTSAEIKLIRVNIESISGQILTGGSERQLFNYEDLLRYAKDHRQDQASPESEDENNYVSLFTKFGELGFVNTEISSRCVYLSKAT